MVYEHEKREAHEEYHGPRPSLPKRNNECLPNMRLYLESRGLNFQLAINNGWYPTKEIDGRSRIVIPCINPSGVVYYQARATGNAKIRYRSPAATRADSIVYAAPFTKSKGAVIVEGPMDALAVADHKYVGIGLMGNTPGPGVIAYIASLVRELGRVIVVPDADCVEMGAYVVGALAMHHIKAEVRTIRHGKDFADMLRAHQKELLK